ncbi:MAG TPA: NfeD family protein [Syntrophorhabdaceae bacterium]|nr:NfeD family protein [Syntrophorhabdaceae bacterium]
MAKWNRKIFLIYSLYQIPGLILIVLVLTVISNWTRLPVWLIAIIVVFWILENIILFPFVWRAYDRRNSMHVHTLVGTTGVVHERLTPNGYIRVRGELWKASVIEKGPPIEKDAVVHIVGMEGLVLLVKKA